MVNTNWRSSAVILGISIAAGAIAGLFLAFLIMAPSDSSDQVQSLAMGGIALTTSPSAAPSETPSVSPSDFPSYSPSVSPSDVPSASPSNVPSDEPSVQPSQLPTSTPSFEPSSTPSVSPTQYPSSSPTDPPLPPDYSFRLKLHWKRDFYWQDSFEEQAWCLECVFCDPIGASPYGQDEGCVDFNGGDDAQCNYGDQLWIVHCGEDRGNARFVLEQHNDDGGDQVRVQNTELCLQRVESKFIQLLTCDEDEPRQRWLGFLPFGEPFTLYPVERLDRCLTQNHHPKYAEVVYAGTCETAVEDNTHLWEALD